MADARTANLLGALLTGLHDHLASRLEHESEISGDGPTALVAIAYNEGRTVEFLRRTLSLSHSWTVRVVENLEKAGLVNKRTSAPSRCTSQIRANPKRRALCAPGAAASMKCWRRCR